MRLFKGLLLTVLAAGTLAGGALALSVNQRTTCPTGGCHDYPTQTLPPSPVDLRPVFTPAAPAPARTAIAIPSATPAALGRVPRWSLADRTWMEQTLLLDQRLDQMAIAEYPQFAATYQGYVRQWQTLLAEVKAGVAGTPITPAEVQQEHAWLQAAIASHTLDTQAHPENRDWNDHWIANYRRLDALWAELS